MEKHKQEYKKLGLNIAYYRKLKGLSQIQLAEAVGIRYQQNTHQQY